MSGGWQDSDRASRLPDNWAELRAVVLRQCQYRCEWRLRSGARCPRTATDVDHIIPGDDHSIRNLQGLCQLHHSRKSAREGNLARWEVSTAKNRPAEGHPGARGVR